MLVILVVGSATVQASEIAVHKLKKECKEAGYTNVEVTLTEVANLERDHLQLSDFTSLLEGSNNTPSEPCMLSYRNFSFKRPISNFYTNSVTDIQGSSKKLYKQGYACYKARGNCRPDKNKDLSV